ncbi:MAG: hypothetical protein GY701_32145 [Sulfitobacter sp.]|nr:hypothetical protein [Sulfitobacter sp.]
MQVHRRRPEIAVLDDVFTDEDKRVIGAAASAARFETQALGPRRMGRARERAVINDNPVAELLWQRIEPVVRPISSWFPEPPGHLTPPIENWEATSCNPRTRFYRYSLGGDFAPHQDEPWRPDQTTRSMLTVLVYLPAGGCTGGETVVDTEVVQVQDWRVAIFDHRLRHEGKPVENGQKLVLRNDVIATTRD